ncbi:ABC transporter ATP-binding protein [Labrys wisconsinensis]|uniref:Spermidine/putrescine transport system ATP-binding protein n=1 Tax=Labrys wisconsinensis TaxID=425677 RepID=A0ABU0JMJ8_9HYPH|nr:ABC transporter ATP-binding protein [Labrys wisconsinensis]MDQ0474598.1 putative spermidine/putrescine transport system ATP-binding protein [Labrys wisconsinensis]
MSRRSAEPVHIEALSKAYGDFRALDDVSLAVEAGEFVAILGPSGSGKSTLLMAVAGFIRPDAGRILFAGRDIVREPANRRGFGVVFQSYALFPHMDVTANVTFPLKVRGVAAEEARARAAQALETVRLGGFGARRIGELSGGQRQRVALARAIVFEPKVLLMDEPLSALDKTLREEMQIEIRELHDKLRITTLYVTHDQREALTIADRIAVMDKGRIVQLDAPEAIYRRPASAFVARFIGEAAILPMEEAARFVAGDLGRSGQAGRALMVRSEDFCLARHPGGDWLTLRGSLRGVVFQGDSWLLQVDLPDGRPITARAQKHDSGAVAGLAVGGSVDLHVLRERVHVLQAAS